MKPWRPAPPERAAERDHDPDSLTASVGRLLESLAECRRERDTARRDAEQQRLRATALLHHLERARALLARPSRPRPRAGVPVTQLPLPLTSRTAP